MILTELFGKADDADFFTDSAGILSNPFNFLLDVKNMQNFRKEEKRVQDSAYCRQEKINVRRKRYDN